MNSFKPLRCVILEDEDDIRKWIVEKLENYPELEIVGEAANIDDAYRLIATTNPEAAFMDVQLIGGDAFTLLNRLEKNNLPIPYIVLATGYPEYVMTALNDYRSYVVQYLVKPFIDNWEFKFRRGIDALVGANMNKISNESAPLLIPQPTIKKETVDFTFLQNKGSLLRLDFAKIAYLEAAGGGESIVVTDDGNHQIDLTLNKFIQILPAHFFRISKSNIINTTRVITINRGERTVEINCIPKNKSLGISDTYYVYFLGKLPLAKDQLDKKN
jgi:two-component system LytT family response regulator